MYSCLNVDRLTDGDAAVISDCGVFNKLLQIIASKFSQKSNNQVSKGLSYFYYLFSLYELIFYLKHV